MSTIVGIDAGGSSTEYAIDRDGTIVRHSGAAANARTLGATAAGERIVLELRTALGGDEPRAIAIGAAGAGDPELAQALDAMLRGSFDARVAVYDDATIAFRAAVPSGDGVVLIAGTGSIACGWFGEGSYRAGGHGSLVGDEGSGFAIGRAALGLTLRVLDGRIPRDPFAQTIAGALGGSDGVELIARIHASGDPVSTIAALAPLVLERASAGDRSASKIVQSAASDLVELVKAVVKRADATGTEAPLVFAGGLLDGNSLLTYLIETRLSADLPLLATMKNPPPPVSGALTLARRMVAS